MPPRLRGHHLFCLHFFRGEGYSSDFVAGLREVTERLDSDGCAVVDAADDVCRLCPTLGEDGTCAHADGAETEIRRIDALALELLGVRAGETLDWRDVRRRLPSAIARWRAEACDGCEWWDVCAEDIGAMIGPRADQPDRPVS